MLLRLTRGMLTPESASAVLDALLDRYTVRSSAHMDVLQCFVRVLMLHADAGVAEAIAAEAENENGGEHGEATSLTKMPMWLFQSYCVSKKFV